MPFKVINLTTLRGQKVIYVFNLSSLNQLNRI